MKFDIKSFVTGVVTGAVAIMAIEAIRGAIIRKKAPIKETSPEEYQEMLDQLNKEFGVGGQTFIDPPEIPESYKNGSDLASEMLKEKQTQYNKYEEEAKKYHNVIGVHEVIDEDAAALERIEEYDDDEEDLEDDNKYKDIDKSCYFIDAEDASGDGMYDVIDTIFCSDGVLVKTDTEEILSIKELFGYDIVISDIYEAFTRANYDNIYIRSETTGVDYSLEWISQSYKEAFR